MSANTMTAFGFFASVSCLVPLASCVSAKETAAEVAPPAATPPAACQQDQGQAAAALERAWAAWNAGEILEARETTTALVACTPSDEALHLAVLSSFVTGLYAAGLEQHGRIGTGYARRGELDGPVVDALGHLGRSAEAFDFAVARGLDDATTTAARLRAEAPLQVSLDGVTEVPFDTSDPLTPYIPAFQVEVEGKKRLARFDTGGPFVVMSAKTATELGVETKCAGSGSVGTQPTKTCFGTLGSLRLGAAELKNVPVVTVDKLPLAEPIIGTNVFEQFLTTIDYPKHRIVFSPRGDEALAAQHMAMLGTDRTQVPFFLWSDHFMFARGSLGPNEALNFFVDSGLVAIGPKGTQAAFEASTASLAAWGVVEPGESASIVPLGTPLGLGPLRQSGLHAHNVPAQPVSALGGVRIDGLISHAFVQAYAWTLDFAKMQYTFSR